MKMNIAMAKAAFKSSTPRIARGSWFLTTEDIILAAEMPTNYVKCLRQA
jgi:hypothetical protein